MTPDVVQALWAIAIVSGSCVILTPLLGWLLFTCTRSAA